MKMHVAVIAMVSICFFSSAEEPVKPAKLTDLKLFADTPQGHLAKPMEGFEFPSTQKRQLFILYFDKAGAGQKVAVSVVGEKTTLGAEKLVKAFEAVAIDAEGRVPVELTYPQNFPAGLYRIDIVNNGKSAGAAGYIVKAAEVKKTAITAAKIEIMIPKAEGGVEAVAQPKAANRHLYFVAATKGARTAGASVSWSFTAVDTSAGKDRALPGLDTKDWPLDDTTLAYDMELPRDWPTGKYRVALKVDDEAVTALDFEIK